MDFGDNGGIQYVLPITMVNNGKQGIMPQDVLQLWGWITSIVSIANMFIYIYIYTYIINIYIYIYVYTICIYIYTHLYIL